MKSEIKTEETKAIKTTVVLEMSIAEALILKGITQNELAEDEDEYTRNWRHSIFERLPSFKELYQCRERTDTPQTTSKGEQPWYTPDKGKYIVAGHVCEGFAPDEFVTTPKQNTQTYRIESYPEYAKDHPYYLNEEDRDKQVVLVVCPSPGNLEIRMVIYKDSELYETVQPLTEISNVNRNP